MASLLARRNRFDAGEIADPTETDVIDAAGLLAKWCALSPKKTRQARMGDLRALGRWQWGDSDPARTLARLLSLTPVSQRAIAVAWDRAEAHTLKRSTRSRRFRSLRRALKYAEKHGGYAVAEIPPPARGEGGAPEAAADAAGALA